jgi:hypothetical protein
MGNSSNLLVSTPDAVFEGRITHEGPGLRCPSDPDIPLGEYELELHYVSASSSLGEFKSGDQEILVVAFLPFLKNPKFAFGLGMVIGSVILVFLTVFYCYKYCKLKKDYEVLKEQSISMSHYKYDKKGKEKETKTVGNILTEDEENKGSRENL